MAAHRSVGAAKRTAPELKHDDYAGLDVRGKIVLQLNGAPATFPNLPRAHYSSGLVKLRNAASRSAAGVITVDSPESAKLFPWPLVVRHSHMPYFRWVERDGTVHNTFPQLAVAGLSHEGAAAILGEAGLTRLFDDAKAAAGLEVSPDPRPQQNFFIRSDQYSFVKIGVPALFTMPGQKSTDASIDAKKMVDDYISKRYHMPSDDMSQPMSFEGGARIAHFHFLIGLSVANAPERPSWNRGDFFGETFGRKTR